MKHTPSTHTNFVIEREFTAAPEAVFQAWADPEAKRSWSDCHAEHTTYYRATSGCSGEQSRPPHLFRAAAA